MTGRAVTLALALLALAVLTSCSSSASSDATTSPSTSTVVRATAPAEGTTVHWTMEAKPSVPEKHCNPAQQCVLLGTETGTVSGDLQGTSFVGTAATFAADNRFVVGRTDVFRGTVKGCGSGTLVFVGTESADVRRGAGEWRVAPRFGTGDLVNVTGHGTGRGTVDAAGFHSQWQGVLDCGE